MAGVAFWNSMPELWQEMGRQMKNKLIIITLCAASFLAGTLATSSTSARESRELTRRAAIRAVLSLSDRCEKAGHLDLAGALEKAAGLALANNATAAKCGTDSECEGL